MFYAILMDKSWITAKCRHMTNAMGWEGFKFWFWTTKTIHFLSSYFEPLTLSTFTRKLPVCLEWTAPRQRVHFWWWRRAKTPPPPNTHATSAMWAYPGSLSHFFTRHSFLYVSGRSGTRRQIGVALDAKSLRFLCSLFLVCDVISCVLLQITRYLLKKHNTDRLAACFIFILHYFYTNIHDTFTAQVLTFGHSIKRNHLSPGW